MKKDMGATSVAPISLPKPLPHSARIFIRNAGKYRKNQEYLIF